ncbi:MULTISPECIES: hypothetical protein [Methanothrix]|uniref:hypothetical protein n=1 Tax=Methanothrix TaxID=2222 RepID=UPI002CBF28C9|nr:hypothetical protein [Methanothrix soehngenii]HOS22098.1 hypothetical protein [Methanothrix soehngenii]HPL20461.1 hypothetical protein [Methanothrix soehngenii]
MNIVNIAAILAFFIISGIVVAAPLPLQLIVNNDTIQCASFLPGDECMDCTPPDGWEILGPYGPCPEDYTLVTVRSNCQGFENERCCTKWHSGASGDCQNLVKNDLTRECAFVDDAANRTLLSGWMKMPENASSSSWLCPHDYNWTTLTGTIPAKVAQYGPVNVASVTNEADFLASLGNNVSGWTWLTQPGQSAAWTFYNLPTNRRLYIYLAPLVTRPSGNGGGSGYSTDVRITCETRTRNINSTVSLKNTHPEFQMPADTMGWGYQVIGYLMIPADKIPFDGKVKVTLTKSANAEHIAVNKECCTIEYV